MTIKSRLENWFYELLAMWSRWRYRDVIGLLRESRGLPR